MIYIYTHHIANGDIYVVVDQNLFIGPYLSWTNIHLPFILMFTGGTVLGFPNPHLHFQVCSSILSTVGIS
jgi:hypothetical protein